MMTTVAGLFKERVQAEKAILDLQAAGFSPDNIGIVMQNREEAITLAEDTGSHVPEDATIGAVTGGVVGGVGAAVLGLGSLVIPGVGPLLGGGILAAALGGALTGGLIGALVGMGFSEDESKYYDMEIRAGRIMVSVRTDTQYAQQAREILHRNGATFYPVVVGSAVDSTGTR
jgi:hypothetical protein